MEVGNSDLFTRGCSLPKEKQIELFKALSFGDPAFSKSLASVKIAFKAGDLEGARRALAHHLRHRNRDLQLRTFHIQPQSAPVSPAEAALTWYGQEVADAASEGRVQGGLVQVYATFPGNQINWRHNETRNHPEGRAYNPEWQWQLNRMYFWHELAKAYRATGNEKYARAWVTQMRSFVSTAPPPPEYQKDNSHGSTWRTIEAGLQMVETWPYAFHSFLLSPSVSDDDLLLYMYCSWDHARHLLVSQGSGNWLIMEMNGLYTVGVVFPEFSDADSWRHTALDKLNSEIAWQFLPDGAQFELTPGYHNVALNHLIGPLQTAKVTGRLSEVPPDYVAPIERAWDFNMRLMTPDRSLPELNDSWPFDMPHSLARAIEYFPERDDFRWIATDGKQGTPPESASHAFDYAGYYVMRSGWERDANYILFDAGPLGAGHVHQDKLNLVFYAWGRELLFNNGGGSYEESPWRAYGIDTFSHNTVLVDGLPQRRDKANFEANVSREPLRNPWVSTPEYDYARGVYDEGYGKQDHCIAKHVRRVYFQKPDILVVADTLTPLDNKPHTYQARWHLLSPHTRFDEASKQAQTSDEGLANLILAPLTGGIWSEPDVAVVSKQLEPEILGWDVRKDKEPQCTPATTVLHSYRDVTGPVTFLTLLVPTRAGVEVPVAPVSIQEPATEQNHYTTTVQLYDGRRLAISCPPDSESLISAVRMLS